MLHAGVSTLSNALIIIKALSLTTAAMLPALTILMMHYMDFTTAWAFSALLDAGKFNKCELRGLKRDDSRAH